MFFRLKKSALILVTKPKFSHLGPTKFWPIRYSNSILEYYLIL